MTTQDTSDLGLEQLTAMRMGVEYRFTIRMRGFSLSVRPLSISETIEVAHEAGEELLGMPETQRTAMMEQTLIARKTIVRASQTSDSEKNPKISEHVLSKSTPAELYALMKEYRAHVDRVDPLLEDMPVEELKTLAAEIKKKGLPAAIESSFSQLARLAHFLLTSVD